MTETPRVTVYTPSRYYGRFLDQAIGSVASQSYTDWELLIIDDGSVDDTGEIASQWAATQRFHVRVVNT